jgi:hypothetical protein
MKYGVISGLAVGLSWAVLAIVQLWLAPLTPEIFIKITVTAGVLIAAIVVVTLVIKEYLSEKKLKQDGFIDG